MSAIREAIKAVLEGYEDCDAALGQDAGLLDALVKAVERVPVNVTIRDLDMEPENVITIIDSNDLLDLADMFRTGYREGDASIAVDRGFLKVKAGNLSWSRPIPTSEYEG